MSKTFLSEETTKYYEDMWIAHQLKELSNGKYWFLNDSQFGTYKKECWSITSDKEWKKINFHFELRWKRGLSMTEVSNLNIRIHLESQFCGEEIDRKAREHFAKHGYIIEGNTFKGEKLEILVTPDFSSEESTKNTIKAIISVLDSSAYQQCADMADEFISELNS